MTATVDVGPSSCTPLYSPVAGEILIITALCGVDVITFEFTPSATDIARDDEVECQTYSPGMALPSGQTGLGCCNSSTFILPCSLTGVLSKK